VLPSSVLAEPVSRFPGALRPAPSHSRPRTQRTPTGPDGWVRIHPTPCLLGPARRRGACGRARQPRHTALARARASERASERRREMGGGNGPHFVARVCPGPSLAMAQVGAGLEAGLWGRRRLGDGGRQSGVVRAQTGAERPPVSRPSSPPSAPPPETRRPSAGRPSRAVFPRPRPLPRPAPSPPGPSPCSLRAG
jgi:hypothetical protein